MEAYIITEIIEQKPHSELRLSYTDALNRAAELAQENLSRVETEAEKQEAIAEFREMLEDQDNIREGDYEIWIQAAEVGNNLQKNSLPFLKTLLNAMLPGPERDKTLLEADDLDENGIPHDGDLYRISGDDEEIRHWADMVREEISRKEPEPEEKAFGIIHNGKHELYQGDNPDGTARWGYSPRKAYETTCIETHRELVNRLGAIDSTIRGVWHPKYNF